MLRVLRNRLQIESTFDFEIRTKFLKIVKEREREKHSEVW
jgi:hypothetical protein